MQAMQDTDEHSAHELDHWHMCLHESAHAYFFGLEAGGYAFSIIQDHYTRCSAGLLDDMSLIRFTMAGNAAEVVAIGEDKDFEEAVYHLISRLEREIDEHHLGLPGGSAKSDGMCVVSLIDDLRKTNAARRRLWLRLATETMEATYRHWGEIEELARQVSKTLRESPDEGGYFYCRAEMRDAAQLRQKNPEAPAASLNETAAADRRNKAAGRP